MRTRIPIDEAIAQIIVEAPQHLNTNPEATLDELRADASSFYEWLRGPIDPQLAEIQARDDVVSGVPVRWYGADPAADRDLIVFVHGGGWIAGSVAQYDPDVRLLARLTGATVVSIDYRLAPEHPFPAGLDDSVAVVRHAAGLPHRGMALVGDSAGGNLAVGTALALRDDRLLDAVLALYPCVDPDAFENFSYKENGTDYLLTTDAMRLYWDLYTGTTESRKNPWAAPSLANLRGLPSIVIASADYDPLRDEDRALAAALVAADVDVTYLPHPGLTHGFQQMVPRVPAATRALEHSYAALLHSLDRATSRRANALSAARN
jgi:acetyl esterase